MELNREQIIKALGYCKSPKLTKCYGCPREQEDGHCMYRLNEDALSLIKELTEENKKLEYTLEGVMHSVDKWLDGEELEQDEVNRAATMREKTLQIVEKLTEENERLSQSLADSNAEYERLKLEYAGFEAGARDVVSFLKADTVRKMQSEIKERCIKGGIYPAFVARTIDQIAKEMLEGEK